MSKAFVIDFKVIICNLTLTGTLDVIRPNTDSRLQRSKVAQNNVRLKLENNSQEREGNCFVFLRFELYMVFLEVHCHTPSFLCQHFFSDKGQDGLGDLLQLLFLSIFDVFFIIINIIVKQAQNYYL